MSVTATAMPTPLAGSDVESLRGQKATTLEGEKARLRKATREFEAFFTYYMLKTMRETVPESTFSKDLPFSDGLGKDIFNQMFDMEIARDMADGQGSIADLLYGRLVKIVESSFSSETGVGQPAVDGPLPLNVPETPAELKRETDPLDLPRRQPLPMPEREGTFFLEPPRRQIPEAPAPAEPASSGPADEVAGTASAHKYRSAIDRAAQATGLDPALIEAVIAAESAGDPAAVSRAGAKGLMQLMDSTAADYGVSDAFDPDQNILAGSSFLGDLLERFGGDLRLALAAYNAGPATVERYGGIPPWPETRDYVEAVAERLAASPRTGLARTPKGT